MSVTSRLFGLKRYFCNDEDREREKACGWRRERLIQSGMPLAHFSSFSDRPNVF